MQSQVMTKKLFFCSIQEDPKNVAKDPKNVASDPESVASDPRILVLLLVIKIKSGGSESL